MNNQTNECTFEKKDRAKIYERSERDRRKLSDTVIP